MLAISKGFKGVGAIVTGLAKYVWWHQQQELVQGIKNDISDR